MPKYLIEVDYSAEGTRGVLADGGTKRVEDVKKMAAGLGGRVESVESFYYTFGLRDAVVIVDLPDNATAAAISLVVGATGAVAYKTTVILTPEEIDRAAKMTVDYRKPGG